LLAQRPLFPQHTLPKNFVAEQAKKCELELIYQQKLVFKSKTMTTTSQNSLYLNTENIIFDPSSLVHHVFD